MDGAKNVVIGLRGFWFEGRRSVELTARRGIWEVLLFSSFTPGKKPDDNPNYQNYQEYSRPDSGLEDISDHLTASQGHTRKK